MNRKLRRIRRTLMKLRLTLIDAELSDGRLQQHKANLKRTAANDIRRAQSCTAHPDGVSVHQRLMARRDGQNQPLLVVAVQKRVLSCGAFVLSVDGAALERSEQRAIGSQRRGHSLSRRGKEQQSGKRGARRRSRTLKAQSGVAAAQDVAIAERAAHDATVIDQGSGGAAHVGYPVAVVALLDPGMAGADLRIAQDDEVLLRASTDRAAVRK